MPAAAVYRGEFGWRAHSLFGALGLRPAVAQHSAREAELLRQHAAGASQIVEIGVAEGGSAWDMREVMDPNGTMTLIDLYPRVVGMNLSSITARRLVNSVQRGTVEWIHERSDSVAPHWSEPIDFLVIDGDHSYEAAKRDWDDWHDFIAEGGKVAFHDVLQGAPWMTPDFGSARFYDELMSSQTDWKQIDGMDSMAIVSRANED